MAQGKATTEGPGFAEAVDSAMATGSKAEGRDLPVDGFAFNPPSNARVVDTSKDPDGIPGMLNYDFTVGRDIFVISRAWKNCTRCSDDVANNVATIPIKGDYVCPHTRMDDYKKIINRSLSGEVILKSETEIINAKDDTVSISVYWLEKKYNHKRARNMRRQQARKGGPAPDDEEDGDDDEGMSAT